MNRIRSLIAGLALAAFALPAAAQLTSEGTGPRNPQSLVKEVPLVLPCESKSVAVNGVATNIVFNGPAVLNAIEVAPFDSSGNPTTAAAQLRFYDSATATGAWTNGGTTPKVVCNPILVSSGSTTVLTYKPADPIRIGSGLAVVSVAGSSNIQYNILWKK